MARVDLMSLSLQDLEMLSNRGTVKRSQRELDEGEVQYQLTEDSAGNVTVNWSEGITTKLLVDKVLRDCPCNCAASGICRHIIRAVIAYQMRMKAQLSGTDPSGATDLRPKEKTAQRQPESANQAPDQLSSQPPNHSQNKLPNHLSETLLASSATSLSGKPPQDQVQDQVQDQMQDQMQAGPRSDALICEPDAARFVLAPWSPGTIGDAALEKYIGTMLFAKAQKLFKERHIVELAVGIKPFAKFHTLSHSVSFLVPNDLRYARCDCAATTACVHVGLAVMAFRKLAPDQTAGTIVTAPVFVDCKPQLISEVKDVLFKVTTCGVAHINPALTGTLRRACETCSTEGFLWPADLLADITLEIERYHARDARYSAVNAVKQIAELFVRFAAMSKASATSEIPVEYIRGLASDQPTEVASTRLIGLGCGGSLSRFGSSLVAYMQDLNNGNLITMKKDFVEKGHDQWRPLYTLAEKPALKALGLGALGKGQILTKGGKLTRSREYVPGRCQFTFNHQSFQWEQLRPPLLAESFAELKDRITSRFPPYVAPRYCGREFYVCAVMEAVAPRFNQIEQAIEAILVDRDGAKIKLYCPYHSVSSQGCELLLQHLSSAEKTVRFVAGQVSIGRQGLVINPVAVIFEEGDKRTMIQPWVDKLSASGDSAEVVHRDFSNEMQYRDPLAEFLGRNLEELGSLLTSGLEKIDSQTIALWQMMAEEAGRLGFSFIAEEIAKLSALLASKPNKVDWNGEHAAHIMIDLAMVLLVAQNEAIYGEM